MRKILNHCLAGSLTGILILFLIPSTAVSQTIQAWAVFSDSARALSLLEGTFHLVQVDTLNTAEIELAVGIHENDTSLLSSIIEFDNPSSLPAGFSWQRSFDHIRIGVSGSH